MITVLSGGTGTPKLLQGLVRVVDPREICVIVNVAEDFELSGMYLSPDVDRVIYTLAGIINEETWYGIRGDTFEEHERIKRLGGREILKIGDRDRAIKRLRTELIRRGMTLAEATERIRKSLGVASKVIPMTNDRVKTVITTEAGQMSFHEFWVVRRAKDRVLGVKFEGIEDAKPAPEVLEAIEMSDEILIGPSNPVTSILPILLLKGVKESIRKRAVAVSPIVGSAPVSGPAGALMKGLGYEVSAVGVAELYKEVARVIAIDKRDEELAERIMRVGVVPVTTELLIPDLHARERLASFLVKILREGSTG